MMDFETMVYSMDLNHGHCPWCSLYIHVLLNDTMVRDHGFTDHGQSLWYVKHDLVHGLHRVIHGLYPWSVCMYGHGHPCFYMEPWSETMDSVTMV